MHSRKNIKMSVLLFPEFTKLSQHLKLDNWLHGFLIDAALYKGRFDEALSKMGNLSALDTGINGTLRRHLRLSSIYYCQGLYAVSSVYVIMHHMCIPPLLDLHTHFVVVVVVVVVVAVTFK